MSYIWFWVQWLAEHVPTSAKYQFTDFGWLTPRDPSEGANIILQLLFLTRMPILKKIKELSNREKLRECLIFDFGCSGWQSTPQNLLNIDLPNLVGWLDESLLKEQKLFWIYTF